MDTIGEHLRRETGTIRGSGRRAVALVYPSPYSVAMASLGYQWVYARLNALPDTVAERAPLPAAFEGSRQILLSYESQRPVSDFPLVAVAVGYELELGGVFACLRRSGIPPLAAERSARDPVVVMGGPLSFSNPLPLVPFADALVLGEAEPTLEPLLDVVFSGRSRPKVLERLAELPGIHVPTIHGETLAPVARCDDEALPARSVITTPLSAFPNMFLIEVERGCSRGCSFCVMRKGKGPGMRVVSDERVLSLIPSGASRVGLVGAAVSDHPQLVEIVSGVVEGGREVGLSSLRADRVSAELVGLLRRGGNRTLTVAADGASDRLRRALGKRIHKDHLLAAARLAGAARFEQLKVYAMAGVPGEEEADLDELASTMREIHRVVGSRTRVSLAMAPFVPKRGTPMADASFFGVRAIERRLTRLRRALAAVVRLRPSSARWAWVEYAVAQGGANVGRAAFRAWQSGGKFGDWRRELTPLVRGAGRGTGGGTRSPLG